MTLLATLSSSGRIDHIEEFRTPGLAQRAANGYTTSGVTCRIIPDELREDVLYLMGQVREERNNGFVEERGVVPNGRPKKSGARGFGRMILPPFGGMLEGVAQIEAEPTSDTSAGPSSSPLALSSKKAKPPSKKMDDDLIILRHG